MDTESRDDLDDIRLDRKTLEYWLSRPVEERLRELERLRRVEYGEEAVTGGVQRVLEVVRLEDL